MAVGLLLIAAIVVGALFYKHHSDQVAARTAARSAAQAAEQARAEALSQATQAQTQYVAAWGAMIESDNAAIKAERNAVNSNDLAGATAAEAKAASTLQTFIEAMQSSIQFPASTEQDVRTLVTAATNEQVAADAAAHETTWDAFGTDVDTINAANTALNDAHVAVTRDLQRLTGS